MISDLDAQFWPSVQTESIQCWHKAATVREQLTPSEWAERYRWIAQGASPLSQYGKIRYDVSKTPWCKEPMDAAVDPEIQVEVLWWASGLAKTETCVNIIGYKSHWSPTNQFIVYPKEESAHKFSRDVLQRSLIDASPEVESIFVEAKSRDTGNTIAYKRFEGGSIYVTSAGSASNFRGPRAGVVYCDEIDAFPSSVGQEGDPILLAFKRAEGFEEAIKLLSGTATFKNHSNIENWLNKSDKRMWFVPCRRCNRIQILMWRKRNDIAHLQAIVDWPQLGRSRHEKAVVLCGHCAASHNDAQRIRMIMDGQWKPTQTFSGIRGYWLNGINSTLPPEKGFKSKLHQFASDAHQAKNSNNRRESVKVWINTFLAETYQEEQNVKAEWRTMYDRREEYSPVKV
jgi:phage terminase large subunit GpA-like protein